MKIEDTLNINIEDSNKSFTMHMSFKDDDLIYFDKITVERKEHVVGDGETNKFELEIVKVSDDFYVAEGHIRRNSPGGSYDERVGNGRAGVREAIEKFFGADSIKDKPHLNYLVFVSDNEFTSAHKDFTSTTPEEAALCWANQEEVVDAHTLTTGYREQIAVFVSHGDTQITATEALKMSQHPKTKRIVLQPSERNSYRLL